MLRTCVDESERRKASLFRTTWSSRLSTGLMASPLKTGLFANSAINPILGAGKATGFLEGNHRQLLNQTIGVAIAWVISIIGTLVILFVVDKLIGLRVSEDDEREGLDLTQHGEEGYDWEAA